MISLGAAKLLGIILETLGYGIFLAMFVYNMYLQIRNLSDRNARRPNVLLLAASTLLFMMITTRWAIGVTRIYEGVIHLEGQIPLSEYFADITLGKQIIVTALFESQVIVADFILIYRLYHVWKPHWWLCIVPSLAWIGVWVSTGLLIWTMTHADLSSRVGVFHGKIGLWVTASFACNIANNAYCTTAIIIRLWRRHQAMAHATQVSYIWRALKTFVESAALLTVFMLTTFVTFLAGYNIQYSLMDATSPVIGISFLMIMLRSNFNKHGSNSTTSGTVSHRGGSNNRPLRSINVSVAHHTNTDSVLESKVTSGRSYGNTT